MVTVSKTLAPLFASSAAITTMLALFALPSEAPFGGMADDASGVILFLPVLGFSALGIFFLVPLAWLLIRLELAQGTAIAVLVVVAAALGALILAWANPAIGAAAGVITAAFWCWFNRSQFRSPPPR